MSETSRTPTPPPSLPVKHCQANGFRTFVAEGAWGWNYSSHLEVSFFVERLAYPESESLVLQDDGQTYTFESSNSIPSAIHREHQCAVRMSYDVAEKLRDWLNQKLKEFQVSQNLTPSNIQVPEE